MVITGSAQIYSIYTSQEVFNGQVTIKISTDGKFLIIGKLNFAADNLLSVSGKLYADLSQVAAAASPCSSSPTSPTRSGCSRIDGKLKMGFRDRRNAGRDPRRPRHAGEHEHIGDQFADVPRQRPDRRRGDAQPQPEHGVRQHDYYVDVTFTPGADKQLDYATASSTTSGEISATLTKADGTVVTITFNGTPLPIETAVIDGVAKDTVVTGGTDARGQEGVQRFRYLITNAGFSWVPECRERHVHRQARGTRPIRAAADRRPTPRRPGSFLVLGPTVTLANPVAGGHVKVNELNGRLDLDITFAPTARSTMSLTPETAPAIRLSGSGVGTAALAPLPALLPSDGTGRQTFRYTVTGTFALGEVTAELDQNTFADATGAKNVAGSLRHPR